MSNEARPTGKLGPRGLLGRRRGEGDVTRGPFTGSPKHVSPYGTYRPLESDGPATPSEHDDVVIRRMPAVPLPPGLPPLPPGFEPVTARDSSWEAVPELRRAG